MTENDVHGDRAGVCPHCGKPLPVAENVRPDGAALVFRNHSAYAALYLGAFSLLSLAPVLTVVAPLMGLAALIFGILGLRHARRHPSAGGRVHAWIGIAIGCIYLAAAACMLSLIPWSIPPPS